MIWSWNCFYTLRPRPTWNPEWASGSCPVPSENTLLSAALRHRPHGEQAYLPPSASCWRTSHGRTAWYGMPTNGCSKRTPAVRSCFVTGNTWQPFTVLTRNISGMPPQRTEKSTIGNGALNWPAPHAAWNYGSPCRRLRRIRSVIWWPTAST